jgi:hypothetical protein
LNGGSTAQECSISPFEKPNTATKKKAAAHKITNTYDWWNIVNFQYVESLPNETQNWYLLAPTGGGLLTRRKVLNFFICATIPLSQATMCDGLSSISM